MDNIEKHSPLINLIRIECVKGECRICINAKLLLLIVAAIVIFTVDTPNTDTIVAFLNYITNYVISQGL